MSLKKTSLRWVKIDFEINENISITLRNVNLLTSNNG